MQGRFLSVGLRLALAVVVFVVLAVAIFSRPAKHMLDFDQSFYLTVGYDLHRHGVFSNGDFDAVDSSQATPPPGMFFAPLYPSLIAGVMTLDGRFADAVSCFVEANESKRAAQCRIYARPMLLIHALLLTLAVLAIARAGETILGSGRAFYMTAVLATAGVAAEAELFSFIMTESLWFCLFSLTMLGFVEGLASGRARDFALAGLALAALCLVKVSFLVLAPILLVLTAMHARWFSSLRGTLWTRNGTILAVVFLLIVSAWPLRNHAVLGKLAFSEEYGSLSLIERFAYNDMTAKEFALAFPYCVPVVGPRLVNGLFGSRATARFEWNEPGSFFQTGRGHRVALLAQHGRVDPVMGGILRDEMQRNWWRHLATMIPLAWCGLWVSGLWSLLVIPLFAIACVAAVRRARPLLLFYAAPGLLLVGLHAAVANHYSRYNLGLIGPFSVGAAWVISLALPRRGRSSAPAGLPAPSGPVA
jgi:hypothetical protein